MATTINPMVSAPQRPPYAIRSGDGHWLLGGVYVGRQITPQLYAEPVSADRFLIRSTGIEPCFAKRVGEVFGSNGCYCSTLMDGTRLSGRDSSLVKAATRLEVACLHERRSAP